MVSASARIVNSEDANISNLVLLDSDNSDLGGGFALPSVLNMVTFVRSLVGGLHMLHNLFLSKVNAFYLDGISHKLILVHHS